MNDAHFPFGLKSVPALRFLLHFDKRGGANYGATGMSPAVTSSAEAAGLVSVFYYRPLNTKRDRWHGGVRVVRHYRKVVAGPLASAFAAKFREELRGRNLAAIDGLDDGHGRVAFNADWKLRRLEVLAAARAAWSRVADAPVEASPRQVEPPIRDEQSLPSQQAERGR